MKGKLHLTVSAGPTLRGQQCDTECTMKNWKAKALAAFYIVQLHLYLTHGLPSLLAVNP